MTKIKESQDKEITFYILKSAVQVGINGSMDDLTINLLLDFVKNTIPIYKLTNIQKPLNFMQLKS